jgi:carnitine 3-dehydrogenase
MRHFMAQFGPALALPWTHLTEVPELDDELLDTIVAQSDAQAAGRSIAELAEIRDDCLVAVLRGLAGVGFGAGEVLAATERALQERGDSPAGGTAPAGDAGATRDGGPLRLHEALVEPSWIDYNGHMTESRYLQVLGDATDAFLRHIGVGATYLESGRSYFTVESHIRHLGEVHAGERLHAGTQLLSHDTKRLHLFHELTREDGELVATGEHMLLHVDAAASRATAADVEILAALARIAADQAGLDAPAAAGSAIRAARVAQPDAAPAAQPDAAPAAQPDPA